MASTLQPTILIYKSDAALAKGKIVKKGTDDEHVGVCSAASDKMFGITQNASTAAEDLLEIATDGGAKLLLGGTVVAGDMLTSDGSGQGIATTSNADKVIAQALEDGVSGDFVSVKLAPGVI